MNAQPDHNTFDFLFHGHNRGKTFRTVNEEFASLIQDVRTHGKGGELLLKIAVKPDQGGDAARTKIIISVAAKRPAAAPFADLYYTREDGGVQKNDPLQEELPFRPVAVTGGAPAPAETSTQNQTAQNA